MPLSLTSRKKDWSCSTSRVFISLRFTLGRAQPFAGVVRMIRCSWASFRAEERIWWMFRTVLALKPLGYPFSLQPVYPAFGQQLPVELLQFQRVKLFQRNISNVGSYVVVDVTPVGLVGRRTGL